MSDRRISVAVLTAFFLLPVAAQEQTTTAPAEEPTAVMSCGDCHEEAKTFVANRHARGEVKDNQVPNAVCESCHGDGTAHIEAGGDKEKISVPRGLTGADETCSLCHELTTNRRSHRAGVHANSATVNCLTCHSIHQPHEPHLVAHPQLELCATCHGAQAATFRNTPYKHKMGRGGLTCSTCHEPHGLAGRENLRPTRSGERLPCVSCHADKRGPFVFPHHAGSVGDCMSCHEPHGSSNPKQLTRATVFQLCLECHSTITADTLGSQPPSFHNLNSPRYRNCTTCHVTVHGSNRSPALLK